MRGLLILAALCGLATAGAAQPVLRVHLLGTGGPELTPDRAGYSVLVEAPDAPEPDALLLFDAGRGLIERLYQQRINPKRVLRIFLTHLHSDHIAGLPDLWMTPWFLLGRTSSIELWGPPGTAAMVAGMRAMYGHDVAARANAFNPAAAIDVTVHEIGPGVAMARGGVRVSAFVVAHADGDPALGYRIERGGRVVTLSGDTTLTDGLVEAARGADLLIQNVIAFSQRLSAMPEMQGVLAKLTTPEQAAALMGRARPRLTVFAHIVKKELPGTAGDEAILARVRAAGAGEAMAMAMGHDREIVEIGADVRLLPPPPAATRELDSKTAEP